jgi:hypothetical protein
MIFARLLCLFPLSIAIGFAQNPPAPLPDPRMATADELLRTGKPQDALVLLNELAAAAQQRQPHLTSKPKSAKHISSPTNFRKRFPISRSLCSRMIPMLNLHSS